MIKLNEFRENIYQNFGLRECPYYGEDGVILKIFEEVGISKDPFCVEFGESRVLGTTTRSFRIKYKSKSLYFTGDYSLKSAFLNIIDVFKVVWIKRDLGFLVFLMNLPFKEIVRVDNLLEIYQRHCVPSKPEIITIDIDSYDYYLIKKTLEADYKPKLFIAEYNPSFGAKGKFTYPFDRKIQPINKRDYGASYEILDELFSQHEYKLCFVSGFCNLFYIRGDYEGLFQEAKIEDEITDTNEKVNAYIKKYCQEGFIPSWIESPYLKDEDLSELDILK